MRFIHTADWQLGKPFGGFDAETRNALAEARFDAIGAVGNVAATHKAQHVLVAGDVFDTEGPEERTIVQALARMESFACHWWLLPGNHDFARNGGLWDRVRSRQPSNVTVLCEAVPVEVEDGVWILPAPLIHRHTLDDPTAAFDEMETPGARLRIGLAHGSIRNFSTQGDAKNLIAPDRAARASLDYLALGDWHGRLNVDERTWYSGTPETDRFQPQRDEPGQCLAVELVPGEQPRVEAHRTGRFQWLTRSWTVNDADALTSECDTLLGGCKPEATLVLLTLAGLVALSDRVAMTTRIEDDLRHRLRHLEVRDGDLVARPTDEDLYSLEAEGMLGRAAGILREKTEAGGGDAGLARRALERLFVEIARGEA